MRWLYRIEDRLNWLAFPALLKYLAMTGVVITLASWIKPAVADVVLFIPEAIMSGEIWRVFSFAFAPLGIIPMDYLPVIFMFFGIMIAFLISDSLESVWGPTRTTLYLLTCWAALAGGMFLMGTGVDYAGIYIYNSMFLAFATLFPTVEFRLMLIIPVQVRWLGWLSFILMIASVFSDPLLALVVFPSLIPYALWVLPQWIQVRRGLVKAAARRRKFELDSLPEVEPFHRCTVCKRTEHDDSDLEFRTFPDGTEYCLDHMPQDEQTPS